MADSKMAGKRERRQVAALPLRCRPDGSVEIMLVTSRETRRWVIPKGWQGRKLSGAQSAAREAREEAGVIGSIELQPVGSYSYDKRLGDGSIIPCKVDVYPLLVEAQLATWPEQRERDACWMAPDDAAAAVEEEELGRLLARVREFVRT